MTAHSIDLIVAIIVGVVGILLAVRSFRRDEKIRMAQEAERLDEPDDAEIRKALRKDIVDLTRRVEELEKSNREKDAEIRELREQLTVASDELELYKSQFTATRKVQSRTSKTTTTTTYGVNKLSGEQKAALRVALLDTYPRREDWEALLQDIDHQLDLVAFGNNLETTARRVLEQAEAGGWLVMLMTEAQKQRPQLAALDDLVNTLLHVLEPE